MRVSRKIRKLMRRDRRANPSVETILARQQRFSPAGVTWAVCVQAVKTDWVAGLISKYRERPGE